MAKTKFTSEEAYKMYSACMVMPEDCDGGLGMKIRDIERIVKPIFQDMIDLLAVYIADNWKKVKIPNGKKEGEKDLFDEFKIEVNDEFKEFLSPLYRLPTPDIQKDDLGQPVIENGQFVFEDEDQDLKDLKDRRREFLKVIAVIEADKKYKAYHDEIKAAEYEKDFPPLRGADFAGLKMNRSLLEYFEPIFKK